MTSSLIKPCPNCQCTHLVLENYQVRCTLCDTSGPIGDSYETAWKKWDMLPRQIDFQTLFLQWIKNVFSSRHKYR